MSKFTSADIYAEVNQRILDELSKAVAAIESGVKWERPWIGGGQAPRNLQSGKHYRGVNMLLLSFADYSDPRWTTAKAAITMGGKIRKGEKTTMITLWKRLKVSDPDAPDGYRIIPMLRYYRVLNVEQIEWPEGVLKPLPTEEAPEGFDPIEAAEDAFKDYLDSDDELSFHWGGNSAYYDPQAHSITLPDTEDFKHAPGFYGTAFHEAAHSTHRACGRELGTSFRNDKYAREELVAEIAASLVCAHVGVAPETQNSAAYLKGWMSRIKDDDKLFVKAAGQAQKAADRILGVTFEEPPTEVKPEEITNTTETVNA